MNGQLIEGATIKGKIKKNITLTGKVHPVGKLVGKIAMTTGIPSNYGRITWNGSVLTVS